MSCLMHPRDSRRFRGTWRDQQRGRRQERQHQRLVGAAHQGTSPTSLTHHKVQRARRGIPNRRLSQVAACVTSQFTLHGCHRVCAARQRSEDGPDQAHCAASGSTRPAGWPAMHRLTFLARKLEMTLLLPHQHTSSIIKAIDQHVDGSCSHTASRATAAAPQPRTSTSSRLACRRSREAIPAQPCTACRRCCRSRQRLRRYQR